MGKNYGLPLLLGLIAFLVRMLSGPWPVDDAYITFRYAENILNGLGMVYNPGEPVLGTTTPLFAMLLVILKLATSLEAPILALYISAVADGFGVYLLYKLARQMEMPVWACATVSLTWAFYSLSIRYAVGGMETSLATTLQLAAFTAYICQKRILTAIFISLALLVRPDSLATAFLLLAAISFSTQGFPWKYIVVIGVVAVPWLVFATYKYGNPLPNSLLAKSNEVYLVAPRENINQVFYFLGGILLLSPLGLSARGFNLVPPIELYKPLFVVALILIILWELGAVAITKKNKDWVPFFSYPLVVLGVYSILGYLGRVMAEWYLVPTMPYILLGVFAGSLAIDRHLKMGRYISITPLIGVIFIATQVAGFRIGGIDQTGVIYPRAVWVEREELYIEAAKFLEGRLGAADIVAAPEIGAFGYYCNCKVLDTVGLVSPEVFPYYPVEPKMFYINYAIPTELIRNESPRFLLTLDSFIKNSLLKESWFDEEYEIVWEKPTNIFSSNSLLIYEKVSGDE